MVSDMHRLEQAARLSLGDSQAPEAAAPPAQRMSLLRFAAFALTALVVVILLAQLI